MDGLPHKLADSQPQHSGLDTERVAFQPQELLKPTRQVSRPTGFEIRGSDRAAAMLTVCEAGGTACTTRLRPSHRHALRPEQRWSPCKPRGTRERSAAARSMCNATASRTNGEKRSRTHLRNLPATRRPSLKHRATLHSRTPRLPSAAPRSAPGTPLAPAVTPWATSRVLGHPPRPVPGVY